MTNSSVQKGKLLEDWVASQIRLKGIDPKAYRSHGSGNGTTEKGDIWTSMMVLGQNAGIEVKNHKNLHIKEWWNQTKKLEKLGREPILVYKIQGQSDGDTLCTIYLDTLLELIQDANDLFTSPQKRSKPLETNESTQNDRELTYALNTLKTSISRVSKLLE